MPLLTTCIGAYPKPDFVNLPDWFNLSAGPDTAKPTLLWEQAIADLGTDAESIVDRGVQQAVTDQVDSGIDIPTDGEIIRENYIHYHCRQLNGFDFENLTEKTLRNGAYTTSLPTIVGPVSLKAPFLAHTWQKAQRHTRKPLKITLPGPLTIADTSADNYYHDTNRLGHDVAVALNQDILALADAGCQHIQIDEPLFARKPVDAIEFGLENVERAFHGCPESVVRTLHICCGYPDRIDNPDYPKADRNAYLQIANAIEQSTVDAVSIEDAHRHNDLALLEHFQSTTVIMGAVAIASSRIESVDEIRERLIAALQHIDEHRLIVAPDCGLGLLTREQAIAKLTRLSRAARSV